MRTPYDYLYLSPHLDDVVLSCGGQISQWIREGKSVLVCTLMAPEVLPDPLPANAARFLKLCGMGSDAGRVRRAEDARACERLGAEWKHADLPDAILRSDEKDGALYPTHESLFERVHVKDARMFEVMEQQLAGLPPSGCVVAPLCAGNHVDHQIVRRAAERALGAKPAYYEDYPYANRWGAVRRLTRPRGAWIAEVIQLDESARRAREDAILEYATQWPMIFGSLASFRRKNRWYLWRRGGERIWRRRA